MAASIILRRGASSIASPLFNRFIINPTTRCVSVAPSVSRSFNTNTQMTTTNFHDPDPTLDVDHSVSRSRYSMPSFFSDMFDPFYPTRTLSQVMNLMDQSPFGPFLSPSRRTEPGIGLQRGWDVKEGNGALHLRIDMPGVDKENVKVSVEQNTLIIKGEVDKEAEDRRLWYSGRLDLPLNNYKIDEIKAEMKNGVLKVVVPKLKQEERKDVHEVKVE